MYSSSTFKGQIDGPYVQEVASATAASRHQDGLSKAVVSFAPAVLRRSRICAVVCRPFDVGFTFSLFGQCALISTMELVSRNRQPTDTNRIGISADISTP